MLDFVAITYWVILVSLVLFMPWIYIKFHEVCYRNIYRYIPRVVFLHITIRGNLIFLALGVKSKN